MSDQAEPKRKQLNVRMDQDTERLLEVLVQRASDKTGLNLSQSDVIRLSLRALKEKYDREEGVK